MTDTDWDLREHEMAPVWGRLAARRPRATRSYGWATSIAFVTVFAVALLAVGATAGWYL